MTKFSSTYGKILLSVFLLLSNISFQVATCGSIVKFLPGFQGPLPFVLETGYVGVGEKEDVQVFYYFIESEKNPKDDPLILWLTGGPGCSALSGLMLEIGPLEFKKEEYNGSLPNLILKPHSWTKVSSIIFVDLPVSTGFTYATTEESGAKRSDWILVHQTYQFLRKWLVDHPKFQSNEVYIAGDSYSGIPIPVVVQEIAQGNEKGVQPWINLQGYILGNGVTTRKERNYAIPFAHGMGLISDELYESLQKNCNGDYVNAETRNVLCSKDINSFSESYSYFLMGFWANDDNVRKALHIRKGSIGKWHRCTYNIRHNADIPNSYDYHVNLSRKGIRSLIYNGDHDMTVPFLATQAWIRSLNYSIVDDWRQWYTDDQVAGYTRTYSNQMTFATVKGGGHTAPEFRPKECFDMFSRWISKRAL
ncbi:serine carboxypeptidase-like 12 isoform X2 [Medicago truncatula]|uniref:serine carboxypeptidase-like 12 isoform X2 n=1 Tax=Medicago truncatula TaxID=3880 RepID=UPI0000D5EF85|nr:serine carboxypeptidase-like 12 isoform X2 [Medicago truncatula]